MRDLFWDGFQRLELRDYQEDAIPAAQAMFRSGKKRIIIQGETGSGKTSCAARIMRMAYERRSTAMFLAHRRELVDQASETFERDGVPHSLIMSRRPSGNELIQIASKGTLMERAIRRGVMNLPTAKLLIVDEAHTAMAAEWQMLLDYYKDSFVIGLTATPSRMDGKGLAPFWQDMYSMVPTSVLLERGFLVPTRVFSPHIMDLRGLKRSGHDYSMTDAARRLEDPRIVGNILQFWLRLAAGRPTICFATTRDHSREIRDLFVANGVRARHIDGEMHHEERKEAQDMLRDGDLDVLCNVGILPEGVDIPPVSCIILARPTRSFGFYRQATGRAKRPSLETGKEDALLLDHVGAVFQPGFGMPDRDVEWHLTEDKISHSLKPRFPGDNQVPKRCPECFFAFEAGSTCPSCGHVMKRDPGLPRQRNLAAGQLIEVTEVQVERMNDPDEKQKVWHRSLAIQAHRGGTIAAAAAMYRARYAEWPPEWLKNAPPQGSWKQPVVDVFPQYVAHPKKKSRPEPPEEPDLFGGT